MALTSSSGAASGGGLAAGANAFASAYGATPGGVGGPVYMGGYVPSNVYGSPKGASPQARRNIQEAGRREATAGTYLSLQDAQNYWYTMSAKQQADFVATATIGGLLKVGDGAMEGYSLWKKLVGYSQQATAQGARISPLDVLASYTGGSSNLDPWYRDGDFKINRLTGEKKYVGPQFKTTTQSQVDLTDPATAKALATSVFQQMMGRDPGKGELASWGDALHAAEQASPVISTTTTEYDDQGNTVGSNTTSQGGLSADAKQYLEQQKVKKTKEYGAVQAGTTYANALENAVYGSPS